MAKEAKDEAEVAEAPPPKKSKKLLIIVALVLVLVLTLAGGATWFILKKNTALDEDGEPIAEKPLTEKKKSGKETPPVYVALEAFTVNLVSDSGEQFLQLVISVEVANMTVADRLKMYTPKLRNNVMLLLSGKKASELISREGKESLAAEIRELMNEVLGSDDPNNPLVREVLFTSFIIQ